MTRAELREHIALTLYLKAGPSDRKGSAREAVRAADLLVDALYPVGDSSSITCPNRVAGNPFGDLVPCVLPRGHRGTCTREQQPAPARIEDCFPTHVSGVPPPCTKTPGCVLWAEHLIDCAVPAPRCGKPVGGSAFISCDEPVGHPDTVPCHSAVSDDDIPF